MRFGSLGQGEGCRVSVDVVLGDQQAVDQLFATRLGDPAFGRLEESGLRLDVGDATSEALLDEIEFALRPPVHERRVPSSGRTTRNGWRCFWRQAVRSAAPAPKPR